MDYDEDKAMKNRSCPKFRSCCIRAHCRLKTIL